MRVLLKLCNIKRKFHKTVKFHCDDRNLIIFRRNKAIWMGNEAREKINLKTVENVHFRLAVAELSHPARRNCSHSTSSQKSRFFRHFTILRPDIKKRRDDDWRVLLQKWKSWGHSYTVYTSKFSSHGRCTTTMAYALKQNFSSSLHHNSNQFDCVKLYVHYIALYKVARREKYRAPS